MTRPLPSPIPSLNVQGRKLKISVISPTYNHSEFLRQNLDATLAQSYPHFEIIVVNDGSTDATHEILTEYASKDPRVVYHRFERNQGVMAAFEQGYQMATGDLMYGSASDDYLASPLFFERVVRSMEQLPSAAGVFGQAELIATKTGKSMGFLGAIGTLIGYIPPQTFMKYFLAHNAIIPGVSCVWRMDLVRMIGGYPQELGPQHDYFVNHALAGLAGVIFLPKVVAHHRLSPQSYNAKVSFQQRVANYSLVEKKFRELKLETGTDQKEFEFWREKIIDNLIQLKPQKQLYDLFKQVIASMDPDFWSYLPESPREFFTSIPDQCDHLEKEMGDLKVWAMDEFKRVTGV